MTASYGNTRWEDGDELSLPGRDAGQDADHSVGGMLRARREDLGWTLPAIAGHLRIRQPFLEAIEEGRIEDLPGRAYAVGFIRTYAQALGFDPDDVSRRFRAETGESARRTELEFPAPVPDRGVPALAVILVGAVIAIGAYAAWYRMSGSDRPRDEAVQQVPDRLAALVPAAPTPAPTPAPAAPAPASATSSVTAASSPSSAAAASAPLPAEPATRPASARSGASATSASVATGAIPGSAAPAVTAAAPAPAATAAVPPRIVLHAVRDAWMRVRVKGGHDLLDRVLRAGETWPVPDQANLVLSTGNAGGTEVLVDGVAMPSLGGDGVVKHDLPLDPGALRANLSAAPAVAKPPASPHTQ